MEDKPLSRVRCTAEETVFCKYKRSKRFSLSAKTACNHDVINNVNVNFMPSVLFQTVISHCSLSFVT